MKKTVFPLLLFVLITICNSGRVNAQTNTATASASATIITPITAMEQSILSFGKFSPQQTGGEVVISPDGSRYSSGTVTLAGGMFNQAVFHIEGEPDYNVAVSLPTMPTMLLNVITGKTMEIHKWTSLPSLEADIMLPTSGKLNLNMGATLKVGDYTQNPVGLYSGTYIITFSYN